MALPAKVSLRQPPGKPGNGQEPSLATGSFLPSHLATLEEQAAEATTAECHLKRAFDFSMLHWPSWITAHGQSKLRN